MLRKWNHVDVDGHACIHVCMHCTYIRMYVLYVCHMDVCMHREHIPYIMIVGGISNDPLHKTLVDFKLIIVRK